jgi:hypothetical protein
MTVGTGWAPAIAGDAGRKAKDGAKPRALRGFAASESSRKLPRQVDTSKIDFEAESGLGRNAKGGTWPRLSWTTDEPNRRPAEGRLKRNRRSGPEGVELRMSYRRKERSAIESGR